MSRQPSLAEIKGLGPKRLKLLRKLGINSILDLLSHFPARYQDRSKLSKISELEDGEEVTLKAEIIKTAEKVPKRGLRIFIAHLRDETGVAEAVWFNQSFLKNSLKRGASVLVTGKAKLNYQTRQLLVNEFDLLNESDSLSAGRIVPVYPSTEGLSQKFWRKLLHETVGRYTAENTVIAEVFNPEERAELKLVSASTAYRDIHFPSSFEAMERARYRLSFEELYLLQISLALLRQTVSNSRYACTHPREHPLNGRFIKNLPFQMTGAQKRVLEEIRQDMEASRPMQRLLQGDVGSGKTVIAACALLKAVGNGYLGVLMAPTEILARQHYETLSKWYEPLGVRTALLVKGISAQDKKEVMEAVAGGQVKMVVGTHALIQENIILKKIGLVVIDEQHRFGVRQRSLLEEKGDNPDVLVMTATPIPRTLALTVYGDLDISILDELPAGRKRVQTYCITERSRGKLINLIRKQLGLKAQIYVVCPLIEESEALDLKNVTGFAVEMQKALPDYQVGLLHGRMSSDEKEKIMKNFTEGLIKVLVTTTVIEVGINNPNATVMVIENAERYGIAQLHQLRGRVGRGSEQSFCILVAKSNDQTVLQRLKMFSKTNDGFKLAEEDLRLRGSGTFFGTRQHGLPEFKAADLRRDLEILKKTRDYAFKTLQADPLLRETGHANLAIKAEGLLKNIIKI